MDAQNLTLGIAFLGGLLSFVSPCVLPLVPAYIGYLGGTTVIAGEATQARGETLRVLSHSLVFVLGFMLVFVLLGASATFFGRLLLDYSLLLQRVGGVLLVVFGMRLMSTGWNKQRWMLAALVATVVTFLFASGIVVTGSLEIGEYSLVRLEESVMMGLIVLAGAGWSTSRQVILAVGAGILNFMASFDALVPNLVASVLISAITIFFNRADVFYSKSEIDISQNKQTGYLRSLLFGIVFAAGWTPCVGPILAAILIVASQLQTVGQGILLLIAYSLGLAIPFLIVGLAYAPLSQQLRKMNRYLGIVSLVSGVLLALMGILIFTNSLTYLTQFGNFFEIEF